MIFFKKALKHKNFGRTHSVMMAGGALSGFAQDANKTVWFRTNSEIDLVYLGQILV